MPRWIKGLFPFLDFGGVRIEDDIIINPAGAPLNLTHVPKEIDDIERLCAEGRELAHRKKRF